MSPLEYKGNVNSEFRGRYGSKKNKVVILRKDNKSAKALKKHLEKEHPSTRGKTKIN